MLPSKFVPWATAILAAVMGGFGVFCAAYSFASPDVAGPAIILLGCACVLSYPAQH
jgi:CBS-domain-containing membrane protein